MSDDFIIPALAEEYVVIKTLPSTERANFYELKRRESDSTATFVLKWYLPGIRIDLKRYELSDKLKSHVVDIKAKESYNRRPWLLMEAAQCSLADLTHSELKNVRNLKAIVHDMYQALHALHHHGIIHGTITPRNILVRTPPPTLDLILSGWDGLDPKPDEKFYQPQESLTEKSDYYALGMVLYEIIKNEKLTSGMISLDALKKDKDIPSPFRKLLAGLLHPDANKRFGGDQVSVWLDRFSATRPYFFNVMFLLFSLVISVLIAFLVISSFSTQNQDKSRNLNQDSHVAENKSLNQSSTSKNMTNKSTANKPDIKGTQRQINLPTGKYIGEVYRNQPHGYGTLYFKDGKYCEGRFDHGTYIRNSGKMCFSDGRCEAY